MNDQMIMYTAIGLGIAFVAEIGLFLFFKKRGNQIKQLKDPAQAIVAKGTIKSKLMQQNREGAKSRYVTYTFRDWQGNEIETKRMVGEETFHKVEEGSTVNITYVRSNPKISGITDHLDEAIAMAERIQRVLLMAALSAPMLFIGAFFALSQQ